MEQPKSKKKIALIIVAALLVVAAAAYLIVTSLIVSIGDKYVSRKTEELTLTQGEYDLDKLIAAIPKFSKLSKISFPETELTAKEIESVRKAADGIKVDYTVKIGDQTYDETTKKIDFSALKADAFDDAVEKLALMPGITEVEMAAKDGSSKLTLEDASKLAKALPDAKIHYEFDLFGQHLTTEDERIEYDSADIGNDGVEKIREALSIMPNCSYVLLDDCGVDNEVMAKLREDFPDKKIVWRVFLDGGYPFDFLTDEQILRLTYGLDDENTKVLNYCTDVVYLDIGHNAALTDFSFVRNMPNLECFIGSIASVTDLSPLTSCQKLIWVELIACFSLTDISPLKDIPSIKYLSISETGVKDITATDSLPNLERFGAAKMDISAEQQANFYAHHPNCTAAFGYAYNPYGHSWRNDYGTPFHYYTHMRQAFRYDDKGFFGNQKISIYCPLYLKDVPGYPWYEWQK